MVIQPFVISPLQSNCYVLAQRDEPGAQAVIVDPGDVRLDSVFQFIEGHQFQPQAVWCTHAHFDHTLGVDVLRNRYQIPAFVHEADLPVWHEVHERAQQWLKVTASALRDPDELWHGGDTASLGDDVFQVVHTPGHSPGCVCLVGESAVISGDMLFAGAIGRVDLAYSDKAAMDQSLCTVSTFSPELTVYPGHGPTTTMARELTTNPFLLARSCNL